MVQERSRTGETPVSSSFDQGDPLASLAWRAKQLARCYSLSLYTPLLSRPVTRPVSLYLTTSLCVLNLLFTGVVIVSCVVYRCCECSATHRSVLYGLNRMALCVMLIPYAHQLQLLCIWSHTCNILLEGGTCSTTAAKKLQTRIADALQWADNEVVPISSLKRLYIDPEPEVL